MASFYHTALPSEHTLVLNPLFFRLFLSTFRVRLCFLPCPPTRESISPTVHNLGYSLPAGVPNLPPSCHRAGYCNGYCGSFSVRVSVASFTEFLIVACSYGFLDASRRRSARLRLHWNLLVHPVVSAVKFPVLGQNMGQTQNQLLKNYIAISKEVCKDFLDKF